MIKYHYALDSSEKLVNVKELTREQLYQGLKFYSLDTREELIPKLGDIRQKHFSRKPDATNNGSFETYLHALGKKVFLDEYQRCIDEKVGYKFQFIQAYTCNRLEKQFGKVCKYSLPVIFNLSSYFNEIKVEKDYDNFRPDITLYNSTTGQAIFVEIAVTHKCSNEKIASNNRIIEFVINDEEGIAVIRKFGLGNANSINGVNLYNFNFETRLKSCDVGECSSSFYFFKVRTDGSSQLSVSTESKLNQILDISKDIAYTIIQPALQDDPSSSHLSTLYKQFIKRAQMENSCIKNCFLCRYHALSHFYDIDFNPIFCKYHKKTCNSNQASKCSIYKVDSKHCS